VGRLRACLAIAGCAAAAALRAAAAAVPQAPPPELPRAAIDAAVDTVIARYRLPGLAVGVVRDGEVVYRRTAGELVAGSGEPVTPDALFKIASNTKAMTAGLLARLVDAGKLRWDDPVVRWLPEFRMHDPWVTREMQVRDLLIHDSGLREGAGDLMLWPEPNAFTRADVIAGLAHLVPVHSFRSRYDYDNLLYIVAGEVAARAGGASYEALVRREVFAPAGLDGCRVGAWPREGAGPVAAPHVWRDGRYVAEGVDGAEIAATTMAAAGGVRCSLDDMLRWVRLWLDADLRPSGGQEPWISPARRDEIWAAQNTRPIPARDREWNRTRFSAYGYGWRLADVDGAWRVAHTGTLSGMYSAVTLLPDRNAGFVFLINADADDARTVLNQALLKLVLGGAAAPTADFYADEIARETAAEEAAAPAPHPETGPLPPAEATDLLGVYRDPWFGEALLCASGDAVQFRSVKSPTLHGILMRAGTRLVIHWEDGAVDVDAWLDRLPAAPGEAPAFTLAKVDPDADFSYDFEDLRFAKARECPGMDERVDELMRGYAGDGPGAALLVVQDGRDVVRRGYGLADLESGVRATPATNFRLASVTKQFTAAAVLLLAEDGRLGLDDPVRRWLPSLPPGADAVTIRHLLTHTSGLVDYEDLMAPGATAQVHDADVLALLEGERRLYFAPGSAWRYSNSGYALLALVVERASGRSFADFLHERIFAPLGMAGTVAHRDGFDTVSQRAYGYSGGAGAWRRTDQSPTSAVLGDGGIYSSIDDLAKWDAALYDDRLLSDASRALAFAPAAQSDDPAVQYGFGWRITGDSLWHSGETIGFRNVIVRFPGRQLTVVLLTNRDDPEPYRTALAIAALFPG
jgi:CubicO group peptidase (beta-lactamase class C family)